MLIRNFAPTDLGEVMRMVAETFMQDYSPSIYISLHMYWQDGFIVASEESKIYGFILGSITQHDEARIMIMTVSKECRNRGFGKALLNEFLNRCSVKAISKVILEVRASNKRAFNFYLTNGFQMSGRVHNHYLDGEDGIVMEKWL